MGRHRPQYRPISMIVGLGKVSWKLTHGRDWNLLHIQDVTRLDATGKKFRSRKTSRQDWKYYGQPWKFLYPGPINLQNLKMIKSTIFPEPICCWLAFKSLINIYHYNFKYFLSLIAWNTRRFTHEVKKRPKIVTFIIFSCWRTFPKLQFWWCQKTNIQKHCQEKESSLKAKPFGTFKVENLLQFWCARKHIFANIAAISGTRARAYAKARKVVHGRQHLLVILKTADYLPYAYIV